MITVPRRGKGIILLLIALMVWPAVAQTPEVPPFDRDARPGDPPPVPGLDGNSGRPEPEILGRGPLHEGYAQPSDQTPRPTPVVPKEPPPPIREVPPEEKPEGDQVIWLPGYWAWDEDRNDFIWISGFWRVAPPGRKWVPGYWTKAAVGWRWVSGFWADVLQPAVPYLEAPPESLERGPSFLAPGEGYQWVPGIWLSRDDRWMWQPGFWCPPRAGWIYTPARYCWTPRGNLFVGGFWDRCLATRGVPFAPAYLPAVLYNDPGFCYQPTFALSLGGMLNSFWARPGWGCYAFGDYYGARYAARGFQPWHVWGPRARDPLFGYYENVNRRSDPGWARGLATIHDGRARGTITVPPRSLGDTRRVAGAPSLAQPLTSYRNTQLPLTRSRPGERVAQEKLVQTYRNLGTTRAREEVRPVPRGGRSGSLSLREVPATPQAKPRPEQISSGSIRAEKIDASSLSRPRESLGSVPRPTISPPSVSRDPLPKTSSSRTASSTPAPTQTPRRTDPAPRPSVSRVDPPTTSRGLPSVIVPRSVPIPAPRGSSPSVPQVIPRSSAPALPRFNLPAAPGGGTPRWAVPSMQRSFAPGVPRGVPSAGPQMQGGRAGRGGR